MLKVLLVDDEPIITAGLTKLINWEELGLSIAGVARDGEEALCLIEELTPDIVITDLLMQGMDGIAFIKKFNEIGYGCRIVILSGHGEFEYAREALKNNVFEYLLKPISPEQLTETMKSAVNSIMEEYNAKRNKNLLDEKLKVSMPILREKFFWELLAGTLTDENAINSRASILDLDIKGNGYSVLCIDAENIFELKDFRGAKDQILLNFAILNIIEELAQIRNKSYSILIGDQYYIILIDNDSNDDINHDINSNSNNDISHDINDNTRQYFNNNSNDDIKHDINANIKHYGNDSNNNNNDNNDNNDNAGDSIDDSNVFSLAQNINENLKNYLGLIVTIGIGGKYKSNCEIYLSAKDAQTALKNKFFRGKGSIIHINDASIYKAGNKNGDDFSKELLERIKFNVVLDADDTAKKLIEQFMTMSDQVIGSVYIYCYEFFIHLRSALNTDDVINSPLPPLNELENEIRKNKTIIELCDWISMQLGNCFISINDAKKNRELDIVSEAKTYIDQHYNEFITLCSVANKLHMSSTYFCTLFKTRTGKGFHEYLLKVRMEIAAKLVSGKEYRVYEIARMVGYKNPRYFSEAYKRYHGVIPTEFKY